MKTSNDQTSERPGIAAIASVRGNAPGLKDVSGKLRLQVADAPAGVLQVEADGTIGITNDGDAATLVTFDTEDTLAALLRGELSPIVARLQDRVRVEGDAGLALRVFLGLQAGSPWNALTQRR